MGEYGVYGKKIDKHFRLRSSPAITAETPRKVKLAVTRVASGAPLPERTTQGPSQRAFLINVHLQRSESNLWLAGRPVQASPRREVGGIGISDLEQLPTVKINTPFDFMSFYVPRTALDELTDEQGSRPVDALLCPPGVTDPTAYHLAQAVLPALEQPAHACKLFVDHIFLALRAHFLHTYGNVATPPLSMRGTLAPWQVRRVKEILRFHLDGEITVSQLANECGLSISHFAHSFRQTFGEPPYRWLVNRRVEMAQDLMMQTGFSLAEIALKCGFSDQTSFTRSFKRVVGASPGAWQSASR